MPYNQLGEFQVLIVDDEKVIRTLVHDVLASLGFKYITAANSGRRAIEMASMQRFDFIITDWCMEDMDGIELVRFVRNSSSSVNPRTPIIMLTGNTEARYVLSAFNAGISGYLIKPFSAAQLTRGIRMIIEHPRQFVISQKYNGPDRRHTVKGPLGSPERRGRRKK